MQHAILCMSSTHTTLGSRVGPPAWGHALGFRHAHSTVQATSAPHRTAPSRMLPQAGGNGFAPSLPHICRVAENSTYVCSSFAKFCASLPKYIYSGIHAVISNPDVFGNLAMHIPDHLSWQQTSRAHTAVVTPSACVLSMQLLACKFEREG